jgi:DnaJ-domain-containing protein 1
MRLPPFLGRGLSLPRLDYARIPWRSLPWGKIVGGGLGLAAGLFGMIFGIIVGHLVDEVLWTHLMRRLLRRFIRSGAVATELDAVASAVSILVLLTDAARCGYASQAKAAETVVRGYLYDRYATSTRRRRLLDIAGEEVLARTEADRASEAADAGKSAAHADPFLKLLGGRLARNERAEVAWLAGRVARDVGPCARRIADDIARRLGADLRLVADAARHEGELDERACMLLGVPQNADRAQVRLAYRRLAAEFHPDGTAALETHQRRQAEEAFIRIREAYEQLMRELGEEP